MKRSKKENKKMDMVFDVMRTLLKDRTKDMLENPVCAVAGVRDEKAGDMVIIVTGDDAADAIVEYLESDDFTGVIGGVQRNTPEDALDKVLRAMFKDILERKSG